MNMASNELTDDGSRSNLMKKVKDISNLLAYMDDHSKIPFISNSLPEIATFVYLASREKDFSEISDKLIIQICSIVFNFKTKPYNSFLTVENDVENPEFPNWTVLEFFQKMHALLQTSDIVLGIISGAKACSVFMKKIMCEIFKDKRSDLEPLKILSLFSAMSGVDIPLLVTANSCCDKLFKETEKKTNINVMALNYILEGCCGCSHYFNLTTAPDGYLAPSDWLEGLMFVLLDVNHKKNQGTWLKCFASLLKMSVSVVEKHLTTIIKPTLLKINMDDADSKKNYCDLFIDLISFYSRLHQLPKFFVKLLLALTECIQEGSLGKYICNGQIFPSVLNSVALHSQELPFGQIIEQWKIFSETYTTFGNMIQAFTKGKGAVFFVSQLFATFLMHCKLFDCTVPTAVFEKFGDLILHTRKELKKNISILSDENKEILPLQRSLIMLCFALGEVKLTYNDCHEESLNDDLILRFPDHVCDCSLLLKFLNEEHCEIFNSWLKGKDKILSFIVFQLLIQKVRGLLHKKELSEDESSHLRKSISFILQHAKENIVYSDAWDTDLCTLCSNNYGCAIWRILLKYFPLIVNSVDTKELIGICDCFRDIILQQQSSSHSSSEMDLKTVFLSAMQSVYFQESKNFQAALTASVWKLDATFLQKKRSHEEIDSEDNFSNILSQLSIFRNKWIKYAESTPKCNEGEAPNSLWCHMKDICSLFNQTLQSESKMKPKIKSQVYSVLQENVDLVFLNAFTLQMNLNFIMQIIDSDSKRPESSLPTTTLVNILSQLCRISLNQSNDTDFHIHMIKIPILQFINFLLKQKKSCIPRQHLIQSMEVCKVSKFQGASNSLSLYLKNFDATFDVCYSLLVYHSEVVLNSTFSFLQTTLLLLRSLIAVGSQEHIATQEKSVQLKIVQAAQNMDRLFTVMCRHKANFAKLVPTLVAEYVDCVQHITLDGNAKEHLLSGMYRLLDLCSEDALKSVSVNINHSGRDIFSNVMKIYKQLKYHGDV